MEIFDILDNFIRLIFIPAIWIWIFNIKELKDARRFKFKRSYSIERKRESQRKVA